MDDIKNIVEQYRRVYTASFCSGQKPKIPIQLSSEQDTRHRLLAAYSLEVEKRGREFVLDEHADNTIRRTARWLFSSSKRGLLLMGTLGNGKSTMLRAIRDVFHPYSTLGDAQDIFDYYKQGQGLKYWNEAILLIDDLGVEPVRCLNFGEYHPMSRLLLHRYDRLLTTIIATNLGVDDIQERYGDRVVDRMFETFEVIKYDRASYRREQQ